MSYSGYSGPPSTYRLLGAVERRIGALEREKSNAITTSSNAAVGALVYNSANQSIANNATTIIGFDSERFDSDGIHDNVTNNTRLTCRTAGKYAISASVIWAFNATGIRVAQVRMNGVDGIIWSSQMAVTTTNETTRQNVSGLIDMIVGDYVELQVKQVSGGALDCVSVVVPGGIAPVFGMVRVL